MTTKRIERILKDILGGDYGGPSLSYQGGEFIIYIWGDAPVGSDILARGTDLEAVLISYSKMLLVKTQSQLKKIGGGK